MPRNQKPVCTYHGGSAQNITWGGFAGFPRYAHRTLCQRRTWALPGKIELAGDTGWSPRSVARPAPRDVAAQCPDDGSKTRSLLCVGNGGDVREREMCGQERTLQAQPTASDVLLTGVVTDKRK